MRTPYATASYRGPGNAVRADKDYVGYRVCDPRGQRIGRTERLFLNRSCEPEYIKVKMGFFGFKSVFIPVQSVAADEERRVLLLQ